MKGYENMKFDKQVLFLGISANELKDGGVYYTVQFFEMGGEPVAVNVMSNDRNADMLKVLLALEFGDKVSVTFALRPADKLYKLGLAHVS